MLPGVQGTVESIVHSLLFGGGDGVKIRSLQSGIASFGGPPGEVTVAISPVDLSKSILLFTYSFTSLPSTTTVISLAMRGFFVDNATIKFEVGAYDPPARFRIPWQVVEFAGNVSVQYLQAGLSSGETAKSFTISQVDPAKAFLVWAGWTNSASGIVDLHSYFKNKPSARLESATAVRLERYAADHSATAGIFIVEVKG